MPESLGVCHPQNQAALFLPDIDGLDAGLKNHRSVRPRINGHGDYGGGYGRDLDTELAKAEVDKVHLYEEGSIPERFHIELGCCSPDLIA